MPELPTATVNSELCEDSGPDDAEVVGTKNLRQVLSGNKGDRQRKK